MLLRRLLAIVISCSFGVCCSTKAEMDPEFGKLPPCVLLMPETTDVTDWPKVRSPRGELTLRLPPGFAPTAESFGIHGGQVWRDADRKMGMSYGYWSVSSFPPEPRKCKLERGGSAAVVVDYAPPTGISIAVWLVGSGEGEKPPYDLVLHFKSPRDSDRSTFEAILQPARY